MNDDHEKYQQAITFDNGDEMIQWLRARRDEVESRRLSPAQEALTWGDTAIRFYEDLVIFVRIISEENIATETRDVRENIYANERRNSLYSFSYSRISIEGDWGHQHRSVLWPIEERVFLLASAYGWDPERMPKWAKERIEFAYHGLVGTLS